ncbi:MAG: hypothetical protein FD127_3160 [Acidimicrobiaceae bacterium]|nr:MAG: hypothetical protein FD127_3160 [Acidimicrobiaceae bacterium]
MRHHGLIEVDPAESLHPLRHPDELETIGRAPHQCSVERAATEVVHGDDLTRLDSLLACIRNRRRLGFG